MPAPGTSWSRPLRAADGSVLHRTQGHRGRGEGGQNGGIRGRSGHLSGDLIVHIMMQRFTEYGQLRTITIYCEYPNWRLIMTRHLITAHYQL